MVNFTAYLPSNHGKITVTQNDRNEFHIYQRLNLNLIQKIYHFVQAIFIDILSLLCLRGSKKLNDLRIDYWSFYREPEGDAVVDCNFLKSKKILSGYMKYKDEVISLLQKEAEFIQAVENIRKTAEQVNTKKKIDPKSLQFADKATKKNKQLVMDLVMEDGLVLEFADKSLQNDEDIVTEAVLQNGNALKFASLALQANKDIILIAVEKNPESIAYANGNDDKNIAIMAVSRADVMHHLKYNFSNNREVILAAVTFSGLALGSASGGLKNDPEIVKIAINQNGLAIEYASRTFKANPEYVLDAVKQNGSALQFVPDQFKQNRDYVSEAVKSSGMSLEFVADAFKAEKAIVKTAVMQDPRAIKFASNALKNDVPFMLELIKEIPSVYCLICGDESLKRNKEFVMASIAENPFLLKNIGPILKRDPEVVLRAVQIDGLSLEWAGPGLKKDPKIVGEAVKQNPNSLQYAHHSLKDDPTLLKLANQKNNSAINFRSDSILTKDTRGIVAEYLFHPRYDALNWIQYRVKGHYDAYSPPKDSVIDFVKINNLFQTLNWLIPDSPEKLKNQVSIIANIRYSLAYNHHINNLPIIDEINKTLEKGEKNPDKQACKDFINLLKVKKEKGIDVGLYWEMIPLIKV